MPQIDFEKVCFSSLPMGVILVGASGEVLFINPKAKELIGMSGSQSPNKINAFLEVLKPEIQELDDSRTLIEGLKISYSSVDYSVTLLSVSEDAALNGTVITFDLLENFEQAARKSDSYLLLQRQFEAVFKSSSEALWLLDGKSNLIDINHAAEVILGAKASEVVGKNSRDLVNRKLYDQAMAPRVLQEGKKSSMIQYVTRTNKHVLSTGTPIFDDEGNISMVVVSDREISKLGALQEPLPPISEQPEKGEDSGDAIDGSNRQHIVAESNSMKEVLIEALKLTRLRTSNILIEGESGTGKGLLAKFIHRNRGLHDESFVEINCAAVPDNLIEAELFGYEKGAFTGADVKGKIGLFEMAEGGVLFLDEIGELPYQSQAKLLKCMEDHEIKRIGGLRTIKINCQVMAATNQDLESLVDQGKFRRDLFHRLNSFTISIPPLRERPEDIIELTSMFLNLFNIQHRTNRKISPAAMDALKKHDFPGNVRELKNILHRAVVMSEDEYICNAILEALKGKTSRDRDIVNLKVYEPFNLKARLQELEKQIIQQIYNQGVSTREMARLLGVSQPSVIRKLKFYKISDRADQ